MNTIDIIGDEETFKRIVMNTISEYEDDMLSSVGAYAFYNCKSLTNVTLQNATSINSNAFNGCSALSKMIVGTEKNTVCTLGSSAIPSTVTSIYVPNALLNNYKGATNWSSLASKIFPEYGPTMCQKINSISADIADCFGYTTVHVNGIFTYTRFGEPYDGSMEMDVDIPIVISKNELNEQVVKNVSVDVYGLGAYIDIIQEAYTGVANALKKDSSVTYLGDYDLGEESVLGECSLFVSSAQYSVLSFHNAGLRKELKGTGKDNTAELISKYPDVNPAKLVLSLRNKYFTDEIFIPSGDEAKTAYTLNSATFPTSTYLTSSIGIYNMYGNNYVPLTISKGSVSAPYIGNSFKTLVMVKKEA